MSIWKTKTNDRTKAYTSTKRDKERVRERENEKNSCECEIIIKKYVETAKNLIYVYFIWHLCCAAKVTQ